MTILSIDTATKMCSAAIVRNDEVIAHKISDGESNHAQSLPVYIEELLQIVRRESLHLDAIALSEGPGSYTGLRIGASTAKGLSYAFNIPLIPIPTTEVLCATFIAHHSIEPEAALCPMIDARRMEVYTAFYNAKGHALNAVHAHVVCGAEEFLMPIMNKINKVYFFGDGAEKCQSILTNQKKISVDFISGITPDAQYISKIACKRMPTQVVNSKEIAYYEPFYLKPFIAVPSHVKGLT